MMTSAFTTHPNIFSHQLGLQVHTFCNYSLGCLLAWRSPTAIESSLVYGYELCRVPRNAGIHCIICWSGPCFQELS